MEKIIETLASKLNSHGDISQWSIRGELQREHQFFASGLVAEEYRTVVSQLFTVNIYYIQGTLQGTSSFILSPHELDLADAKIEKAAGFCKKLISNRLYFLPSPQAYPRVHTLDRELKDDPGGAAEQTWEKIGQVFRKKSAQKLSTAEIFITHTEHFLLNSLGAGGTYEDSKIVIDFVVTAASSTDEAESHAEINATSHKNIDIARHLEQHNRIAADKLSAALPPSGIFDVVISREAMTPIFDPYIFHSSGKVRDMGISSFTQGHSVCRGRKIQGDRVTLSSHPRIPYGLKTFPFDNDGVAAKTVKIVDRGIFKNVWATKEYADYLKIPPTGAFGNLVVEKGIRSPEELLEGDAPVLDIHEFSFLHPDNTSGDFVDEIRLGYLHEKGKVTPIKGGSISGNVFDAMAGAYFSKNLYTAGYYIGPESVRFTGLTVSGK